MCVSNIQTNQNTKQRKKNVPKIKTRATAEHTPPDFDEREIRIPSFPSPLSLLHARTAREGSDLLRLADEVNRHHPLGNIRVGQTRIGRLPLRDSGDQHQRRYALPTCPRI